MYRAGEYTKDSGEGITGCGEKFQEIDPELR
jgi:hypothetical protein